MRIHVRKYILGGFLVAVLSMTAPAMAAPRNGGTPSDFLTRLKNAIVHLFDVDANKMSLPPG